MVAAEQSARIVSQNERFTAKSSRRAAQEVFGQ
jgi:hypothetical protein